jgi:hypothetical protein
MLPHKSDKKPYGGILAEPVPKYTALTPPADGEIDALIDAKMKALFAHYGLDSADAFEGGPRTAAAWATLAWHLARQHVPASLARREGVEASHTETRRRYYRDACRIAEAARRAIRTKGN